ncbi:MAG: class I SAM-dependent methyltransferase [Elusimicrobia bacterium]|nr:class I SAM-dependent methyltransferase [Elusimicrobiota bacterium]
MAGVYRKYFIKRNLERFIFKYFKPGSELLHAGCGSGQLDSEIAATMRLTAMDISEPALELYRGVNGESAQLLHGSLFEIPRKDGSIDGIFNLGVMEHFSPEEIQKALLEFKRVLRHDGKIVLFWPPSFGFSGFVFKLIYFIANDLLRRNLKLSPDEITNIRSREHARSLLERAGFQMMEYYFGWRDMFVQVVLVAGKKPA